MNNRLETIDFYCGKCKRTFRAYHVITGNDNTPVMPNFAMKCHHCNRVVMLKNYTEGQAKAHTKQEKFYL